MSELDLETVRHALSLARKHGFAEVELSVGESAFTASLAHGPAPAASSAAPAASGEEIATEPELKSIFSMADEDDFPATPRPTIPREAR